MSTSREDVVAANREGWNEAAPRHKARNHAKLLADFRKPGFSCLDAIESAWLRDIDIDGCDVAQLCCNNGREILSVRNLAAGRCVGFDLSDGFIEQARELAEAGGIDCEFVRSDVHAIPDAYDSCFDLVYITIGVLGWMPALDAFFAVANRLLRAGGRVFVYEQHPILDMFEPFDDKDPPLWVYSYFRVEPFIDEDGLDYFDGAKYESKPLYWFHHKMSDIFMACLGNGLAIERFEEFAHTVNPQYADLEASAAQLPLSYALVCRKAG